MVGAARAYQLLREEQKQPDKMEVFRSMVEARRWLGLD